MSVEPVSINGLFQSRTASHPEVPIVSIPDKELKFHSYTFAQLDVAATL